MKILRNYILREFVAPLIMVMCVLGFVMTIVGTVQDIANQIINRGVDIFSLAKLFLFMSPYMLTYALPIALLIATLLAFGRLSGDNEIIAIRASGVNLFHLVAPLILLGFIVSLALVIFNNQISSYAHFAYRKTLLEIGIKNPTAAFEEGVFINSFQKYILFIYNVDRKKNRLNNVRIYEPQGEGKPTRTIIAKSGEFITDPGKNTVKLKLMDGTSDEPDPQSPTNFYKLNFKTYFMNLFLAKQKDSKKIEKKPKEMTIQELQQHIKELKKSGIDPTPEVIKIMEKLTLAFSALVFMLLAIPMGIITRRREKSINMGIALLIISVYYPLFIGCETLGIQGILNPAFSMWIPNIVFGAIGTFLTIKLCVS
jgi:lipopolysaccharide export system permease protein